MKFAVAILACVLAVASAQFNDGRYNSGRYYPGQYKPYDRNPYDPFNFYSKNPYQRYSTPTPYRPFVTTPAPTLAPNPVPEVPAPVVSTAAPVAVPVVRVVSDARSASILKYGNEANPDGSYNYYYETDNGIAAQAQGIPRSFGGNPPVVPDVSQGSFSWTSPEGIPIQISYVADENGYQPSGSSIPVPPALPPQIARALEYTAKYHKE